MGYSSGTGGPLEQYDLPIATVRGGSAEIDLAYRYLLTRGPLGSGERRLVAVGLNPSTADAVKPDPTTTRLVALAKREGCAHLVLINLYALRSRDPRALERHADPVGPHWAEWLARVLRDTDPKDLVLLCWGASGPRRSEQPARVLAAIEDRGLVAWCLGRCRDGSPRHPLLVRADTALVRC